MLSPKLSIVVLVFALLAVDAFRFGRRFRRERKEEAEAAAAADGDGPGECKLLCLQSLLCTELQ